MIDFALNRGPLRVLSLSFVALAAACGGAQHRPPPGTDRVTTSYTHPGAACRELGPVVGEATERLPPDELIIEATYDARARTAWLGGNYLHLVGQPVFGPQGTNSATVTGTAFLCPTTPAPVAAASTSGPATTPSDAGVDGLPPIVSTGSPQPAPSTACTPACRQGFDCVAGQCVSACNPPCPDGQACFGHGADALCRAP